MTIDVIYQAQSQTCASSGWTIFSVLNQISSRLVAKRGWMQMISYPCSFPLMFKFNINNNKCRLLARRRWRRRCWRRNTWAEHAWWLWGCGVCRRSGSPRSGSARSAGRAGWRRTAQSPPGRTTLRQRWLNRVEVSRVRDTPIHYQQIRWLIPIPVADVNPLYFTLCLWALCRYYDGVMVIILSNNQLSAEFFNIGISRENFHIGASL